MKKFTIFLLYILTVMLVVSCGTTPLDTQNTDTTIDTSNTDAPGTDTPEIEKQVEGNGNRVVAIVMGRQMIPEISGKYNSWSNGGKEIAHIPDKTTEEGLRDIASVYYPSIGLYDSSDPDYQEYMMQLCKICYIDTINYYVPTASDVQEGGWWNNHFTNNVSPMLEKYGLYATARLEHPINSMADENDTATVKAAFTGIIDKLGDRVLKIDGRPVLSQFSVRGIKADMVEDWKVEYFAKYGTVPFFMLREDTNNLSDKWNGTVDGYFGWTDHNDLESLNLKYTENVGDYRSYITAQEAMANHDPHVNRAKKLIEANKISYYAEGLCPGFDDLAVWGWGTGPRKDERGENAEVYIYKWQSAVRNNFPMVTIPTWDDWGEATTIEPTLQYGTDYLEITRKYAAEYKDLEANTANLELPGWIYKIRKSTKDESILAKMDEASQLIADGKFDEAEALVSPYVTSLSIPATSKEFFNYPTTPTTPLVGEKEGAPIPTKGADGEEIFAPTADTFIKKVESKQADFGSETSIIIKSSDSTKLTRYGYIKFDTSNTKLTEVKKATLRLYCTYASKDETEVAGRDINLYATETEWEEQSFTWATHPAILDKLADIESSTFKKNTWTEIDVTDYVKAHLGETISFAMLNEGQDTKSNHIHFNSREADLYTPELVIE